MKDLDIQSKVIKMSAQLHTDYTSPLITASQLVFKAREAIILANMTFVEPIRDNTFKKNIFKSNYSNFIHCMLKASYGNSQSGVI